MIEDLLAQHREQHIKNLINRNRTIEALLLWWFAREGLNPIEEIQTGRLQAYHIIGIDITYYYYKDKPLVAAATYEYDVWKLY